MKQTAEVSKWLLIIFLLNPLAGGWAAEVVDRVVAIVGGEMITLSDVKEYASHRRGRAPQDPLEALIREKLLRQEMDRLGITATDPEIRGAIQEVLTRNQIGEESLKKELSRKGTSWMKYKKDLADQIREMKFMGQVIFPRLRISDDEILKKAGPNASEEARLRARMELLQERAPEERNKYLDEVRAKTYVEIKK